VADDDDAFAHLGIKDAAPSSHIKLQRGAKTAALVDPTPPVIGLGGCVQHARAGSGTRQATGAPTLAGREQT